MKMLLALAVALMALSPSPGFAQGGLLLHWDDCSEGGTKDKVFACDTNEGDPFVLYASFTPPAALPRLLSATFSFHVGVEGGSPVPWWQTNFGACRSQAIDIPFRPGDLITNCPIFWSGPLGGTFQLRDDQVPGFDFQLYGAAAGSHMDVRADGTEWTLQKITLTRAHSTGDASCAGCLLGAEVVFDLCLLDQVGSSPDYAITQAAWPGANRATWNAGPPTVAVARSWGAIKGLLR